MRSSKSILKGIGALAVSSILLTACPGGDTDTYPEIQIEDTTKLETSETHP